MLQQEEASNAVMAQFQAAYNTMLTEIERLSH